MKASYKVGLALILCYLVAWLDRMAIALTIPAMEGELGLEPQTKGYIISAFFLGYALFQVPGGLLADRFGPRRVIIAALSWWSCFTALTGMMRSLRSMIAVRFLFGVGEGIFPASVWKVISQWFTKKNRASANALIISSIAVGPAITPFVLVPLLKHVGWRGTYYCIGLLGVICVLVAWRYVYDSIEAGRGVGAEELAEYRAESSSAVANLEATGDQASFASILRTPLVWVIFFVGVIGNVGLYGWLQWLPDFFKKEHHLEGAAYMFATATPWIAASVGCALGGFISDRYFRGRRKYLVVLCQLGGVAGLYAFTRVQGAGLVTGMAFQAVAGFCFFMGTAAIWSLPVNLLPAKVMGTASGLINTGGQIGGVLSGVVIGTYIKMQGGNYMRMWDVVLAAGLVNAVLVLGGIWEKKAAAPVVASAKAA